MAKHGKSIEQIVFNRIVKHLCKQGKQSVIESGECMYRAGTHMCAAGCLISDREYHRSYEQLPSTDPAVKQAIERSLRLGPITPWVDDLIRACQRVHDSEYLVTRARTSIHSQIVDKTVRQVDPGGSFNTNLLLSLNTVANQFGLDLVIPKKHNLKPV